MARYPYSPALKPPGNWTSIDFADPRLAPAIRLMVRNIHTDTSSYIPPKRMTVRKEQAKVWDGEIIDCYILEPEGGSEKLPTMLYCHGGGFFLPIQPMMLHLAAQYATVMVGMGGNGVDFGVQLAGTGNRWYITEAPKIKGTFLKPTYKESDLIGYLGDSCVTEVWGLGGMSAIAGPAYMRLTGSNYAEARSRTEKAKAVSLGEHTFAPVPWEDMAGFPVGVDARKVVGYNILPISHGGSALRAGGQGGAGAAELPLGCFKEALRGIFAQAKEIMAKEEA